ncbi:3-phosphoinositide-dependent protein kinase 1 isoform X1 [Uranotaenia lowii]|uniref:3-phosphoinositide-dependent protein kinase 1 isoform X1 n=1 Tax=Uranotaenia lowii TaxID=190385 RepID=UPI002478EE42|nr:3-phosphoinositide-dependent protein kinase 1 isoform X1 [Uranotaenia lowii]
MGEKSVITSRTLNAQQTKRNASDFVFGKLIGEGSYSVVYLAKDIHTGKEYAVKVCEKSLIVRERKQDYVKREREALNKLSGLPGFLNLYCTFQDPRKLYFVMTYATNGTLLQFLDRTNSYNLECAKFYSAEILLTLEYMHKNGIIHRDLKPENILLDDNFHVMIADFGSSRLDEVCDVNQSAECPDQTQRGIYSQTMETENLKSKRGSFVGTAQYVSPEILKGKTSSRSSDLWSYGCIIYQMLTGVPPFQGPNDYLIFQKISKLELIFPEKFDEQAKDLVVKLLVLDPRNRLGFNDSCPYTSIRNHKFFEGFVFSKIRDSQPHFISVAIKDSSSLQNIEKFKFPSDITPGLNDTDISRLIGLDINKTVPRIEKDCTVVPEADDNIKMKQKPDIWQQFVGGETILKQGFIIKRKGTLYVARRRMLLLTSGPRLIYVDPIQMVVKGEIPWDKNLRAEAKNFKNFFIHTTHRTYFLEDPQGYALEWCEAITDKHKQSFQKFE